MYEEQELKLELQDNEWPLEYIDHDRNITRAIVYDEVGMFYFVRAVRDDDFGKATLIETAGGGVEQGEDLITAIKRELKEELGVQVDIVCKKLFSIFTKDKKCGILRKNGNGEFL